MEGPAVAATVSKQPGVILRRAHYARRGRRRKREKTKDPKRRGKERAIRYSEAGSKTARSSARVRRQLTNPFLPSPFVFFVLPCFRVLFRLVPFAPSPLRVLSGIRRSACRSDLRAALRGVFDAEGLLVGDAAD